MSNRDIYVATRTFLTELDGKRINVVADKTFVRHGHPLLEGREKLFKKVVPHYEVAAPKATPRKKTSPSHEGPEVTVLPYSMFKKEEED